MNNNYSYANEEYQSEFDDEEGSSRRKKILKQKKDIEQDVNLLKKSHSKRQFEGKPPSKDIVTSEYEKHEKKSFVSHFQALDAFTRHKMLVNHYSSHFGFRNKRMSSVPPIRPHKTDLDVIRDNHKFVWDFEDEQELSSDWGKRLAKSYYDKLFKEYCISDLSKYKENKIALRWRTEEEVINGKGQFFCADKHCKQHRDLESWEVNFCYFEDQTEKNALVKISIRLFIFKCSHLSGLCPICSLKLNHHRQRKKATKQKTRKRKTSPDKTVEQSSINKSDKTDDDQHTGVHETNIWKKAPEGCIEKSKNDEFDDFLDDLFS